jgi:hypothetical protein
MTARETDEYRELRATIRERGTARVWLAFVGIAAWALLATAAIAIALPWTALAALLVLAVAFEAVYALHTGVERVGRYLQVHFETPGWESTAMAYGARFGGASIDPLFSAYFWMAGALNVVPAALAEPVPLEWALVGAAHVAFGARVAQARLHAGRQRAVDLERFRQLRESPTATSPP